MGSAAFLSPVDALIDLVFPCRLGCMIPVLPDLPSLSCQRNTVIPLGWPACRGYPGRVEIRPDVIQDVPDVGTVRDEGR